MRRSAGRTQRPAIFLPYLYAVVLLMPQEISVKRVKRIPVILVPIPLPKKTGASFPHL